MFHHMPLRLTASLTAFLMVASAAHADLRVSFDEGAPKDRFNIKNISACTLPASVIVLDLSTSQGGLIFDVSAAGEGVEVFQPFELIQGADAIAGPPTVLDGHSEIRLDIVSLSPQEAISFTIDVDDTRGQRAITVTDAEITGATVSYQRDALLRTATFSGQSVAEVSITDC